MGREPEKIREELIQKGVEIIYDMGADLWICNVPLNIVKEQDLNARVMRNDMQDRLTANIKGRGQLESLPLFAYYKGVIEIVSGHHRCRSAREAGIKNIVAIVDVSDLSRSKIASKQLAHNAIEGIDDEQTLKEICKMIDTVEDMLESAVDETLFKDIKAKADALATPSVSFDFKQIVFSFLPHQLKDLEKVIKTTPSADMVGVADREQFEHFVDALGKVQKFQDVKAVGAAIHWMVTATLRDLEGNGYEDEEMEWVPVASLLGGGTIPKESAESIKKAIAKAEEKGVCTKKNKWRLLENLCVEYLSKG